MNDCWLTGWRYWLLWLLVAGWPIALGVLIWWMRR